MEEKFNIGSLDVLRLAYVVHPAKKRIPLSDRQIIEKCLNKQNLFMINPLAE